MAGQALIGLGELSREWGDLDAAERCLIEGIHLTEQWTEVGPFDAHISLARVRHAQGDMDGAWGAIRKARELAVQFDVTDLDDRTIEGAEKAGQSLKDFTEGFYQEFLKDLDTLNIRRATEYPKASEYVEDMIEVAQRLMDKGYAYEKLRSVYFDISRSEDYGKLSKIDLDKIRLGKTVDLEEYEKENPRDFTLLKRASLNELK